MREFRSKLERRALEENLLEHAKNREELARAREILQRLGWIQQWIDIVRSRIGKSSGQVARVLGELRDNYGPGRLRLRAGYIERCRVADKLTLVPTPEGLLALLAGTEDLHMDVREVCIRDLGRLADPVTLPVLIEELIEVIEGRSGLSVRHLKIALVQFPLEEVDALREVLQHSHRRVRFFVTDIIREIADRRADTEVLSKNDFSPDMCRLFTTRLCRDQWGDVRARAAVVIGHFHDSDSNNILERLLQDDTWFVRLHACRATAGKFFLPLAPAIAERITDSHWLVREAAVRGLREMGEFGVEHILRIFLSTEDRYAAEQICEEIQRTGIFSELLADISSEERRRMVALVTRRMVSLGKTTMLLAYVLSPVASDLKLLLIEELSSCYSPECLETLQRCSQADPDPAVRSAASTAFQTGLSQATAAMGGN